MVFALQLAALAILDERQHRDDINTTERIIMPISTHRAGEIIRALQGMENDIRRLRNEVEDSLVQIERRVFFHIRMQVRILDDALLVRDEISFFWWNCRVGEIRSIDFDDGTVTLWLCALNGVDCLLNVSVHAVEEIEYDSTGDGAYPSDWSNDDN